MPDFSKKGFQHYERNQWIEFDGKTFAFFLVTLAIILASILIFTTLGALRFDTPEPQLKKPQVATSIQIIETLEEKPIVKKVAEPDKPEIKSEPIIIPKQELAPQNPKTLPLKKEPEAPNHKIEATPEPNLANTTTSQKPTENVGSPIYTTPLSVSSSLKQEESEEHIFYRKLLESMINEKLNQYKLTFPEQWKTVAGSYIIEISLQENQPPIFRCITPSQNFYFNQVAEVITKKLPYPPLHKYNLKSYQQIFIFTYRPYREK